MSETVVPLPPRGEAIVKADPAINSGSVRVSAPVGGSGLWEAGGYVYEPYLPGRYQGENGRRLIYMMASRDPTIRAMLLAMKLPIRTVLWHMQPATDDAAGKEAAAFGESLIAGMATAWNDVLSEILTEIEYGWSALELVLCRREDGRIGIGDLQPRAQDTLYRWDFDDAGNVTAMHQQLMSESVAIPAERLVLFRTECHKNSPEGRSMLLSAADSYRALRHITQIESIAIERDFTGIPVAYIPAAALADQKLKASYTQIVRDLKMNDQAGLVLPSDPWRDPDQKPSAIGQYRVELVSAPGRRAIDTDKIINRHQTDMARSVLADFLMLGMASKGSFALSRDRSEMFEKSLTSLVTSIEEGFDRGVLRRIWAMNGLPMELKPRWKAGRLSQANLGELGEFVRNLGAAGFSVANDERERALAELAGLPIGTLGTEGGGDDPAAPAREPASSTPDKPEPGAANRAARRRAARSAA